ncbi:PIN domain-containing protein [Fischerella sp. PCC 9605]|uniref:PIN domain-containing protein n=1 Tax=Fischerella sp. PCC 9605 TaxID=1173024 RepID=UPI0012DF6C40
MILYVETNFLMGIAKGQDSQAENLLRNTPNSVRLAVPSFCYVEALTTLEQGEKYNQDFLRRLDIQINEAQRAKKSQPSQLLGSLLDQSRISFLERINEIERNFYLAFNLLASKAEMITLNPDILQGSLNRTILEKHIIDQLILECIIHHARLNIDETKVFLSSNSKEFGKREVIEILQDAGIQYFNKTQNLLGWLQAQ